MENNTTEAIKILGELMEKAMLNQKFNEKDFKNLERFKVFMGDNVSVSLETKVLRCLNRLCIPTHLQGYNYIKYSITLLLKDDEYKIFRAYPLYYSIAQKYNTTAGAVERTIRHSISKCWELCPLEVLTEIFGSSVSYNSEKPCNSQFITGVVAYLKSHC